jgi:transposase
LIGDKGYDTDHLRLFLQGRGTTPTIPNKINRKRRFPFDAGLYRLRNVIERTFCRLKIFGPSPHVTTKPLATISPAFASSPRWSFGSIESTP